MSLQVKLVQKVGQISMSANVTTHLKEGWQPYGSPYVAYEAAAQVMFLPDDAVPAPDAEYALISKYGLVTVGEQVIEKMGSGWNMFGEPFTTQYGPTHAMTKGEFTIFMPNLGFGEGTGGSGGGITEAEVQALIDTAIAGIELPEEDEWKSYVDKGDQAAIDTAKGYTDEAFAQVPPLPHMSVGPMPTTLVKRDDEGAIFIVDATEEDHAVTLRQLRASTAEVLDASQKHTNAEIAKLDGTVDARLSDLSESVAADFIAAEKQTLELAAGHADDGDTNVLKAANDYADAAVATSAEQTNVEMLETVEAAILGAQTRWEAGDLATLEATRTASVGSKEDEFSALTGLLVNTYSHPEGNRAVHVLPHPADVRKGQRATIMSVGGNLDGAQFGASIRVKMAEEETRPFKFRSAYKLDITTVVVFPNCLSEFISDGESIWYFTTLAPYLQGFVQPTELGEGDLSYVYDPVTNTDKLLAPE